MSIKVGTSDVGVYIGSEKIAGIDVAPTFPSVEIVKKNANYNFLYFDCREVSTITVQNTSSNVNCNMIICYGEGDDITFDDAGDNSLHGTTLATITPSNTMEVDVSEHNYIALEWYDTVQGNHRGSAVGTGIITGAPIIKLQ